MVFDSHIPRIWCSLTWSSRKGIWWQHCLRLTWPVFALWGLLRQSTTLERHGHQNHLRSRSVQFPLYSIGNPSAAPGLAWGDSWTAKHCRASICSKLNCWHSPKCQQLSTWVKPPTPHSSFGVCALVGKTVMCPTALTCILTARTSVSSPENLKAGASGRILTEERKVPSPSAYCRTQFPC